MKTSIFLIGLIGLFCQKLEAVETTIVDSQGMECFVYTPDKIDSAKTYQLVVGVHGAGGKGKGAAGMSNWAERGDVIVIGPSFQSNGNHPYQNGDDVHADKLIALFKKLKEEHKLQDKMFLYGFSGGSQFTHRFTMNFPQYVCGVSAHSGGAWATDGFGTISNKAKSIPFAISCGEKDTALSFAGAKFNRLEWYKHFRDEIDKKGFCYIGNTWPDVGHQASEGAWDLTRQCFQLATGLPGKSATVKVPISTAWKNLDQIPQKSSPTAETNGTPTTPKVDPARLAQALKVAFARADTEEIPNSQLVVFMEQYPPALWKEQKGAKNLLQQCESTATKWKDSMVKSGRYDATARKKFETFANGLEAAQ